MKLADITQKMPVLFVQKYLKGESYITRKAIYNKDLAKPNHQSTH